MGELTKVFTKPFMLFMFEVVELGMFFQVSGIAFSVYFVLRRYVWRAEKPARFKKLVVSKVTYKRMRRFVPVSKRHFTRLIQELVDVKWLKVEKEGRENVYVLGYLVKVGGREEEVLYMEEALEKNRNRCQKVPLLDDDGKGHFMAPIGRQTKMSDSDQVDGDWSRAHDARKRIDNMSYTSYKRKKNPPTPLEKRTVKDRKERISTQSLTKKKGLPSSWGKKSEEEAPPQKNGVNAHSLVKVYRKDFFACFDQEPTLTGREMKHLADFAKWWGKQAALVLTFAVVNWERVSRKIRSSSMLPTLAQIYIHREAIHFLTFSKDPWNSDTTKTVTSSKANDSSKKGW